MILSTWGDVWAPLYKHRELDFQFGYSITHIGGSDLTKISDGSLTQYFVDHGVDDGLRLRMQSRVQHLREKYDYGCGLGDEALRRNLKKYSTKFRSDLAYFLFFHIAIGWTVSISRKSQVWINIIV